MFTPQSARIGFGLDIFRAQLVARFGLNHQQVVRRFGHEVRHVLRLLHAQLVKQLELPFDRLEPLVSIALPPLIPNKKTSAQNDEKQVNRALSAFLLNTVSDITSRSAARGGMFSGKVPPMRRMASQPKPFHVCRRLVAQFQAAGLDGEILRSMGNFGFAWIAVLGDEVAGEAGELVPPAVIAASPPVAPRAQKPCRPPPPANPPARPPARRRRC